MQRKSWLIQMDEEKIDVKIDVKIGTPREKWWTTTKTQTEEQIVQNENNLEILKEIVKLADKIIAEEQKV